MPERREVHKNINCRDLPTVHAEYSAKHDSARVCEKVLESGGRNHAELGRIYLLLTQDWEECLFLTARLESLVIQAIR